MPIGRRVSTLLVVLSLVGAPALVLRLFCVGSSCDAGQAKMQAAVPFCPLPDELRRSIAAGFREGRSPDVMGATAGIDAVRTEVAEQVRVPWSGTVGRATAGPDTRVPIVMFGGGIEPGRLLDGVRLDAIAPTLESITGLRRAHPDVRTGEAIDDVTIAHGEPSPLIVLIAWKGLGTPDLEAAPTAWPSMRRAMRDGAGTLEGVTGSLPLDPAAALTTIGSGGLPSAHGITGTLIRDDEGDVRRAWSAPGVGSVIATFADDLDHDTHGVALVGAVLTDPADRGIIGNGWYLDGVDRDTVAKARRGSGRATVASRAIATTQGFGRDAVPDLLGVVLEGSVAQVDEETADIVATIREMTPGATFVIAGTGSLGERAGIDASSLGGVIDDAVGAPVVEAAAADGYFLDRAVLVDRALTAQRVADVLRSQREPDGAPIFADIYPSFAVAFSRYC
jgi:hypothetical protein